MSSSLLFSVVFSNVSRNSTIKEILLYSVSFCPRKSINSFLYYSISWLPLDILSRGIKRNWRNNIISCIVISFTHQVDVLSFIVLSIVALFLFDFNKQHLETRSCVCGYCTYRLFLCFHSLWNIPKNARELGIGRRQFPLGVNGLIWFSS